MNKNLNTNDDYYIDDEYNEDVEFEVEKEKRNFNPKILLIPVGILMVALFVVLGVRFFSNRVSLQLSSLSIEDVTMTPKFKSSTYEYQSTTEEKIVYIGCKTKSNKAKVEGCNREIELKTGKNEHNITVSYEKKKKTYKIQINREVNIDFTISGNVDTWTANDIVLTVDATASNPLHESAYSFDGGKSWQKENKKTFTKNQEVTVMVRDSEENISKEEKVTIDKIDKTVPKITISKDNTMLTATINPKEASSGYAYQWYKDNKIISGATSLVYKTNGDGVYKLVVTTGAGKKVEKFYTFTTQKPTTPSKPSKPSTPSKPNSGGSTTKPSQKPQTDPKKVSGVQLDKTNITMKLGSTTLLNATVTPSTAQNKRVVWSSSDNAIATVSQTGQVRAKKTGTVTITVYTEDGNKKATCKITITK